jgi:transcriptional regulator with XRE-family HTH domain
MNKLEFKKIRKELNLTQREMAQTLKLKDSCQTYISDFETGKRPIPEWIAELARYKQRFGLTASIERK